MLKKCTAVQFEYLQPVLPSCRTPISYNLSCKSKNCFYKGFVTHNDILKIYRTITIKKYF